MYRFVKRLTDIIFSLFGVILLIPISLVIKIAYLLTGDFHSIFYSQVRIGKDGKRFRMYKFRTMVPNAEKVLKKLLEDPKIYREYTINHKIHNDPRTTTIGKIIRKVSIDEFPQCINVLFGQMSIVGNRPYLPREKAEMGKNFSLITAVKPGITGYWQVSGRNNLTFHKRVLLEKEYPKIASLGLDAKIYFKTVGAVFSKRGAK